MVNSDGKRFVNELANRKVRADAIMLEQQEGKKAFAICNEPNVQPLKKQRPGFLEKMLDAKILDKYDTVEAMAKGSGIPLENLQKTIAAFNEVVKAKKDPVLGRYINNDQVPMVEGPWYIGECQPKVHHCMGGLYTDNDCRVIDVRTDQPIPGLFAAGEASGGVHGAVRLGSCATLDCLVFGRIAGRKAAA
ncbi:FAD-binding protein [Sutterella sp.]|uniref:FAD-binding protein n=1 Tax=Sutterella sp. TaxID=1981025 RepID=UPI003FD880BE